MQSTNPISLEVSPHAAERYQQHFRPCLSVAAAEEELHRLVRVHGILCYERPPWVVPLGSRDECDAWIVIGDDLVMPVVRVGQRRRLVAKTTIAKGCITHKERDRRKRRRARRARRRRGRRP